MTNLGWYWRKREYADMDGRKRIRLRWGKPVCTYKREQFKTGNYEKAKKWYWREDQILAVSGCLIFIIFINTKNNEWKRERMDTKILFWSWDTSSG